MPMRNVSAGTQGKGAGERGGDESDAMDASPAVVPSSPARPARPYAVHLVDSSPGTRTTDTRHLHEFHYPLPPRVWHSRAPVALPTPPRQWGNVWHESGCTAPAYKAAVYCGGPIAHCP